MFITVKQYQKERKEKKNKKVEVTRIRYVWQKREEDDLGHGKLNITHVNENIDMCRTLSKYKY